MGVCVLGEGSASGCGPCAWIETNSYPDVEILKNVGEVLIV